MKATKHNWWEDLCYNKTNDDDTSSSMCQDKRKYSFQAAAKDIILLSWQQSCFKWQLRNNNRDFTAFCSRSITPQIIRLLKWLPYTGHVIDWRRLKDFLSSGHHWLSIRYFTHWKKKWFKIPDSNLYSGVRGVTNSDIENEIGDLSSNPGWDCLRFAES